MSTLPDPFAADRLDRLVRQALAEGADAADAVEFKNISVGVSYRLGKLEDVGRAESSDLGLRVFIGTAGRVRLIDRLFRRRAGRVAGARGRHGQACAGGQIRGSGAT